MIWIFFCSTISKAIDLNDENSRHLERLSPASACDYLLPNLLITTYPNLCGGTWTVQVFLTRDSRNFHPGPSIPTIEKTEVEILVF